MQPTESIFPRTFPEPFIPIGLERRHITSRRDIETEPASERPTLIAPSNDFFCFDTGGMFDFECPINSVQHVATHISQGTIAEIMPTMPFVRVQVGVKVSIGRRTNPLVPMQTSGDRFYRRAWTHSTIRAICPTMGFGDIAHNAAPHKLAQSTVAILAMSLVAHLSRGFATLRHLNQLPAFSDVVRQRFLAVNRPVQIHRQHGSRSMMMIGRSNEHGVNLLADLVVHSPVISKYLSFLRITSLLL
jgi:hypothetical protein